MLLVEHHDLQMPGIPIVLKDISPRLFFMITRKTGWNGVIFPWQKVQCIEQKDKNSDWVELSQNKRNKLTIK